MLERQTDLAWAAGFFDGEGNTGVTFGQRAYSIRLQLSQTDAAVLHRFWRTVGHGKVYGPYSTKNYRPTWSPYYRWVTGGTAQSVDVLNQLWPYLSEAKRSQAIAQYDAWYARPLVTRPAYRERVPRLRIAA